MNPSAPDWIPKYYTYVKDKELVLFNISKELFYRKLQESGFIYGVSIKALSGDKIGELQLTREELSKVNLFHAFFYTYVNNTGSTDFKKLVLTVTAYYENMGKVKFPFYKKLSLSQNETHTLENILSARINESSSVLKKNSVSLFTYAFLYCDVLGFDTWLKEQKNSKEYNKNLENAVLECCFEALQAKKKKNKYDKLLIDLFAPDSLKNSLKVNHGNIKFTNSNFILKSSIDEKKYIIDLCCLAIYNDGFLDLNEVNYISQLSQKLSIPESLFYESSEILKQFTKQQQHKIKLFEYTNPVKQIYKQSAITVKLLVLRNKTRLINELKESGELLMLLSKSTRRDLTVEEKEKVKEQLLDICKSIPSLTIFLLPGGTILLPLLIKFIPKLLPSAFDDNRIK